MTTFQTQCPHCQHRFVITQAQLGLKNGFARCGNCKQIFSAQDNLILPTSATPADTATVPSPAPPIIDGRDTPIILPASLPRSTIQTPKGNSDSLLFDDRQGIDDPAADVPTKKFGDDSARLDSFNLDILEDFDKAFLPVQTLKEDKAPKDKNPTPNTDESWLEELLQQEAIKEQNQSYLGSSKIDTQTSASDVSSLLESFGVAVTPEKTLDQSEYQARLDERLLHQPTAQQVAQSQPVARTLLWGLGSVALLLGLVVQYSFFNQDSVLKNPQWAAAMHSGCDILHLPCNLPYAELKAIEAKTLSFEGKEASSDIIISLTNHSSQNQLYPNLKITLQSNNTGVAQFIATPQSYLDDSSRTFMPQQIKAIKLRVNFPRNKADQVSVDPFY